MLPGQVIAQYRILERLGRDQATVLYRARDLRLDRDVAIKVLPVEDASHPDALERFRREARIASLVSHPHICAVHDSGEQDGYAYLVCELLDGRALDEIIGEKPLGAERLLDLSIQLADALAATHRRAIVHGNIKPSNVFVTTDGHVKLLELGALTASQEHRASTDSVNDSSPTMSVPHLESRGGDGSLSVHPYLAPEQVGSGRYDHRADIFSIGALMYEMATGRAPFEGDTSAAIIGGLINGPTPRAREANPSLPESIDRIIDRALERDPDRRYQAAADLYADLRRARRRLETSVEPIGGRPGLGSRSVAIAVLLAALGLAGAWWWWRAAPVTAGNRPAVLLGQIANGTGDPDFDGTLRQALTVHLGQSPFLDLASDERIRQTLQLMGRSPDTRLTHDVAREVCQRLGLDAMVEGSVSAIGRMTVVALVATDCVTAETIARDQIEVERREDVLGAAGQLAGAIRASLGESSSSLAEHDVPIEEATTPSLEALKAYTEGVTRRAAGQELDSIPFFERAITLDPRFALAYTTLSSIYGGLGETGRSEEYAALAYEHRGQVSEGERLFITYQYHDRVTGDQLKAREALEVWKTTYPNEYRAPNALAVLLNRLGDYEGAIREAEEAMRRNPSHAFPYSNLAYAHRGAGHYTEARRVAERAVTLGVETLPTRRLLYQLAELEQDEAMARRQLEWAESRSRTFDFTGARAQVAGFRGRMKDARSLYAETVAAAQRAGFPQIAQGYASQVALLEALYGYPREAAARARDTVRSDAPNAPTLRAAAALALAGEPDEAERSVRSHRNTRPDDTLLHGAYLPIAEAAVLLARGRFDAVPEALRRAAPYERGQVAALVPAYLRATARLRSGDYAEAARDFRIVIDNRGADPFSPLIPLAQLGLARSLAQAGDTAGSRQAHEALLTIWRNADPDVPVVGEAIEQSAVGSR